MYSTIVDQNSRGVSHGRSPTPSTSSLPQVFPTCMGMASKGLKYSRISEKDPFEQQRDLPSTRQGPTDSWGWDQKNWGTFLTATLELHQVLSSGLPKKWRQSKYLVINLVKNAQDLHTENYKALLRITEALNMWISDSRIERGNCVGYPHLQTDV